MGKVLYPGYFPNECGSFDGGPRWVQSDLSGYMRIFWRVKKWRITITLTDHGTTPGDGSFDFVYQSDAGSEEELACVSGSGFHLIEHPAGRDKWVVEAFNIFPYFTAANDFRPYIILAYEASDSSNDKGAGIGDGAGVEPFLVPGDSISVNQLNISNFGNDTATITWYNILGLNNMITEISALKAEEYWSYGGTYDTTTGEPL